MRDALEKARSKNAKNDGNEEEMNDLLAELEQLVRRMDLEARAGGNQEHVMKTLRDCKAKVHELKGMVREAKEEKSANRVEGTVVGILEWWWHGTGNVEQ